MPKRKEIKSIKPKYKSKSRIVVREANQLLKKQYIRQKNQQNFEQEDSPNQFATEKMECAAKSGAGYTSAVVYKTVRVIKNRKHDGAELVLESEKTDGVAVVSSEVEQKGISSVYTEPKKEIKQFTEKIIQHERQCSNSHRVRINREHIPLSDTAIENREQRTHILPPSIKYIPMKNRNNGVTKQNVTRCKPDTVAMQNQADFYACQSSPQMIQKAVLQKQMQMKLFQKLQTGQQRKRFIALEYVRDFTVTAVHSVAVTAKSFLAMGVTLILLICIMFFALLSAVTASPFGILFSNAGAEPGTMSISAAVAEVNRAFTVYLDELQSLDNYTAIYVTGEPADMAEVVAVFAVKIAGNENAVAADVIMIDQKKLEALKTVFSDMTKVVSHVETKTVWVDEETSHIEKELYIQISSKAAQEMAIIYGFSLRQHDALNELLIQRILLEGLIQRTGAMSAEADKVLNNLPEDLSVERKAVVRAALSLVGKVNYFWGGKSLSIGWDSSWGELREVTAAGSPTTGTYRLYGLDCSGFVDWAFFNATGGDYIIGQGGGVKSQRAKCEVISWNEARAGDLVFYADNSHVGIVCGRDDAGNLLIVHCASGANNVVITGANEFDTAGRPVFFEE